MRELYRILFVLSLMLALSCSSQVRRQSTADADLPPGDVGSTDSGDDYLSAQEALEDSTDVLEFQDPEAPESQLTDDEIIYKFSLAEEYYAFGVAANLKKKWDEAQYNFEKAIDILTSMDLTFDTTDTENVILEHSYRRLMNEITSDYKLTLFNLNILSDYASPYAIEEKFRLLDSLTGFARDTIYTADVGIEEVTYDMPIVLNDRVKKWIIYFQTSARKNMEIWLARSSMYIPLMERILEEEGVPHDLVYLPIIESGFSARAYSSVAAIGFWQFMSYTARDWGLKINWWYDERRDFEKATRAAAKYLRFLYETTGDWRHALTAYNGGLRNVNIMKNHSRNKGKDFWDWRIRNSQMRNFVPKFMAAAIIAKQPERYGFDVQFAEPLEWDVITIDRSIYLKDIAKATGVSVEKIKELNPSVLRDYTPPDMNQFRLRIPKGRSQEFFASYADMKSPKETSWVRHRIRRGETVSTIARKYRVSQSAIIQANNLRRPYRIYVGHSLMIPVPLDRSSGYARNSGSYELTGDNYIVRPGDNLSDIARGFGTTPERIAGYNNLRSKNRIYVGQKLRIPGYSGGGSYSEGEYFTYTVRKGDNLTEIARRYGASINAICRMNGISTRTTLLIGQKLRIPGSDETGQSYASSSPSPSYDGQYFMHTVRRGQNLSYIAKKYGTSVSAICSLNGISSRSVLHIGQTLRVPGSKPSEAFSRHSTSGEIEEEYVIHRVRRGQNLTYIAGRYHTDVNAICRLNGISRNSVLYVGQELKIPFGGSADMGDYVYYIVRYGDTLWDIAQTFGTSTSEIINLNNHINPRKLRVGEKLKIRAN
jgi:membrane-bound lytic murein transglycosylase D